MAAIRLLGRVCSFLLFFIEIHIGQSRIALVLLNLIIISILLVIGHLQDYLLEDLMEIINIYFFITRCAIITIRDICLTDVSESLSCGGVTSI